MKNSKKRNPCALIIIIASAAVILLSVVICLTIPQIPDDLNEIALSTPTVIYSDSDQIIKVLANREVIPYEQIPQNFINAILAMEDTRFFQHHGLDKRGLLRAIVVDLIHLRSRQGGSSITQQLAKNLFYSFDKSWDRKLKEMLTALQLERQFSKQEILHAYCNQITFGSNVYGVELGAQTYFGKHAQELNLAESALLAGIPRWPSRYNPYVNADIAMERQRLVLSRMYKEGFITQEEMESALQDSLVFKRMNLMWGKADYFVEEVTKTAEKEYGSDAVYYGGLKIHTTLDIRLQNEAVEAVTKGMQSLDELLGLPPYDAVPYSEKQNYPQAALVTVDPQSGKVLAMVGGRDFRVSQYNRATATNRHAGSAFKPFLYLAAIDRKIVTPSTVLVDELVTYEIPGSESWTPENFDKEYRGPVIVKYAIMKSINTISAKLIFKVTPEVVVEYAKRMGIESPLEPHYSLALGTAGVSPLEMSRAFGAFANSGVLWSSLMLKRVETYDNEILDAFQTSSKKVVNAQSIYILVDMLRGVIEGGTGQSVKSWGFTRPCAGKTGTSSDFKDSWFVGFTPNLVTAVWVGFDDARSMYDKYGVGITGARGALPIWTAFMKAALENQPVRYFTRPAGIEFKIVDPKTGTGPLPGSEKLEVAIKAGM